VTAPLDPDGPTAPPRSNGELVFAEPWESRAFGMVVTLFEAGVFPWSQFQAALIARVAAWEQRPDQKESWSYYEHWLGALEDVLVRQGTVSIDEVTARAHTLARRPRGHDHTTHEKPGLPPRHSE
jgi:nitrile hydratase accessory protein